MNNNNNVIAHSYIIMISQRNIIFNNAVNIILILEKYLSLLAEFRIVQNMGEMQDMKMINFPRYFQDCNFFLF